MNRKQYLLKVSGCQMSFRDAEIIAGQLENLGYSAGTDESEADIIIFQTCCVREAAERKIYSQIDQLKPYKRQNRQLIIGVTGCLAQKDQATIFKTHPHVDFVLGTKQLAELKAVLCSLANGHQSIVRVEELGDLEGLPSKRTEHIRAYINITYGCDNFCSYCIVPFVRGREISRQPKAIMTEALEVLELGYPEIMLLGQNVNSYGHDLDQGIDFSDLLEALDQLSGLHRLRYMTSHPKDFTSKMLQTVKDSRCICEHFHLPIQSGSNEILRLMNRGYSKEHFLSLVENIRQHIPQASITTDIIVGFPGETEENFEDTLSLIQTAKFDAAYTFIFSPRSGTEAAQMPNHIPDKIKRRRLRALNDMQNEISHAINQDLIGQNIEVLIEGPSKNDSEVLTGRTRTNKLVHFNGPAELTGQIAHVVVKDAYTWTLHGHLVTNGRQ